MAEGADTIAGSVPLGATLHTDYLRRKVKVYAVTEGEVMSLTHLHSQTTVFSAAATALMGSAMGIWTNAAFVETLTPEGRILAVFGAGLLVVLAVISGVLAYLASRHRVSTWDRIRAESLAATEQSSTPPVAS